jgi:hypothetical protein
MVIRPALPALALVAFAFLVREERTVVGAPAVPELKAEFIERFTRFVDWNKLPDTFAICVVGDSAITSHLEKIARRNTIKGKRARIVKAAAENVVDCQIALIAGDDRNRLLAVIGRTDGRPILSIAEAPGAAAAGAIINFYVEDAHIKFEINISAAKRSGLTLRSKLLSLARIVDDVRAAP